MKTLHAPSPAVPTIAHSIVSLAGILVLLATVVLPGCGGDDQDASSDSRPQVSVGIEPVAWIVRQVGGDRVDVEVLLPTGQDPHSYSPPARQIARLGEADALVVVGLPFEQALLDRVGGQLADVRIVHTSDGIALRDMEAHHHHEHHDADDEHEHHEHNGKDPHIWLSPANAKQTAETIANALCEIDPAGADTYRANLATCRARLDAADAKAREALAGCKGRTMYVFHPAYGYLLEAYGLHQRAIEVEGKSPTARDLVETLRAARADGARAILTQPQKGLAQARTVADDLGVHLIVLDPLAGDLPANIEAISDAVADALAGTTEPQHDHEHESHDGHQHEHD